MVAMLFHTPAFVLGFLPVCLAGCAVLGQRWRLPWVVCCSLGFYGWWNPAQVPLLLGSIAVNWALGWIGASNSGHRRPLIVAGIVLNLLWLGWFKYADFLLHIAEPAAPALGIVLPLGISFFTFQQIMYLAGGGGAPLLPYAGFVTFFPHLIAGPIVRPTEIIPQLTAPGFGRPDRAILAEGSTLFLLGLAKKLVLADTLAPFADTGFAAAARGDPLTLVEAWYALLAYALQIYFDFSGYSDMATGLARMLNVRFPLNFRSPYQARDIADFWRRWHITLGGFLRDHVYIPLGGNRRWWPLLATMLLCGLWHGAAWRFVLWGGLHGGFLLAHRYWRWPLPAPVTHAVTLAAVVLAWVPFRADTLDAAWNMLRGLAGANGFALPRMIVDAAPWVTAIATPVPLLPWLGDARTLSFPEVSACLLIGWTIVLALPSPHDLSPRGRAAALTAGFAFTLQAMFLAPHVAPFLYFQF